ncbi:MAG: hypothetical protein WKF95_16970 [Rubrobacter sp.]
MSGISRRRYGGMFGPTTGDDALVELTAAIAWENSSSKFNRALRVPSQGLWERVRSQER